MECSVSDVLVELSSVIDSQHGVTKFNISRAHVWDGTRRAILCKQYSPRKSISVKFTDDMGQSEGAVDQGGPKHELFQLLINYLASASPVFMGPDSGKHLSYLTGFVCMCFPTSFITVHLM